MLNFPLKILGMGNKFFGDDGAGIVVAEKLEKQLCGISEVSVESTSWGGLGIIDLLSGYKSAIIIDALTTNKKPVGYICKFDYKELINSVRMVSFHDVNFATAVEFAKQIDIPIPEKITVYAIEIKKAECFSEKLTEDVAFAVDKCVQMILGEINESPGIALNYNLVQA
jgi:hydrogenase maturation protease